MAILLVACSNSEQSINNHLFSCVLKQKSLDSLSLKTFEDIPMLSRFITNMDEIPSKVKELYGIFRKYSLLVFFAPEHNGYLSAFLKNILDWLSLVDRRFMQGQDVILISASTTQRDQRVMQFSVEELFKKLGANSFEFMNVNRYGSDSSLDLKRASEIVERIGVYQK